MKDECQRSRSAPGGKEGYEDGRKAYRWESWIAWGSFAVMLALLLMMMMVVVVARLGPLRFAGRGRSRGRTS